MARILLENVNVSYPLVQDYYKSLRRAILRVASGGRLYNDDGQTRAIHALKNISFELKDGDRIGLIGRNGAGKSTLLRTIGGFLLPDSGNLTATGETTALFSVAGGMDIERSGYDNIYLMGRLLGIPRGRMATHVADIEEFSELGPFLKMPVRSYSDGMKIRLGFAVVTCVHPEILLMDEAIGAGDAHFLEKAALRAQRMYERASIMIMASHSIPILQSLCNKALWLEHGQVKKFGGVQEVAQAYMDSVHQDAPMHSQ
jgi:ABC-type polysaccharide/polyol phosphate transport system ATPase subunit